MFEPPEKGERATLNPNLSTRLKPTFFRSGPWAAGWLLLVEEGERRCLAVLRGRKTDRGWLYPLGIAPMLGHRRRVAVPNLPKFLARLARRGLLCRA